MTRPLPVDPDEPRVMEGQEVRLLLAKVMGYDNRNPGDWNVAAWQEAAKLGRWTLQEAADAVARHFLTRPDVWLMPAHVNALVRAARSERSTRYRPPEPRVLAAPETRAAAVASFRDHLEAVRRRRDEDAAPPDAP